MRVRGVAIAAALIAAMAVPAVAPGCNAMSGSTGCDIGFLPGVGEGSRDTGSRRGGALPPMSTLGGDLSGTYDRPGTMGAVTFGSGGRKCSGMFRSVGC
jgi:hypothetical protein